MTYVPNIAVWHACKRQLGNACCTDHRRFIVQGVYDLWDIHPCTTSDLFGIFTPAQLRTCFGRTKKTVLARL
jgi:hypothetical protein